jgi:hypothetical protein
MFTTTNRESFFASEDDDRAPLGSAIAAGTDGSERSCFVTFLSF